MGLPILSTLSYFRDGGGPKPSPWSADQPLVLEQLRHPELIRLVTFLQLPQLLGQGCLVPDALFDFERGIVADHLVVVAEPAIKPELEIGNSDLDLKTARLDLPCQNSA